MPPKPTVGIEAGAFGTIVRYAVPTIAPPAVDLPALVVAIRPGGERDLQVFKTSGGGSYLVARVSRGVGPGTWRDLDGTQSIAGMA